MGSCKYARTFPYFYKCCFIFWFQCILLGTYPNFQPTLSQSVQVEVQKQICLQRGSPKNVGGINKCAFHDWTLEDKFERHVCEPSADWLQDFITFNSVVPLVDLCSNLTTETCHDDNGICASDNETIAGKGNPRNCFTPPLLVLQSLLDDLLPTYPELDYYALKLPSVCMTKKDSTSCSLEPGCYWKGLPEVIAPSGSAPTPAPSFVPTVDVGTNQTEPGSGSGAEGEVPTGDISTDCVVNSTFRQEKILELGAGEEALVALTALDDAMLRCSRSMLPDKDGTLVPVEMNRTVCGINAFRGDQTLSGTSLVNSLELCVWRGNEPKTDEFAWAGLSYPGNESEVIFSNCTIPRWYMAEQILSIYFLNDLPPDILNSTDLNLKLKEEISSNIALFVLQDRGCNSNNKNVQLKREFILVWQIIITQTVYLCALTYLAAGLRLAWVTRKDLREWSWRSVRNILFIFATSIFAGGMMGFVLGAIPSILLTKTIERSSVDDVAVYSLGYAQGIIILYFDFGRAII